MSRMKFPVLDLQHLIDHCSDAILVVDERGIVRYSNLACDEFLEQPSGKMVGNTLPAYFSNGVEGDHLVKSKFGGHRMLDYRKNSGTWEGRPATVITIRDVTDQRYRQTAQLVEELSRQQIEKWKSLETLAGGIAHQFNNLLMIILGNCSVLKRGMGLDQPIIDRIGYIEKSSLRAIEITNHLLAFAGLGRYEFREIDVSKTINGIKYIFESMAARKAKMEYNLDANLPPIYGDESQLQRMLYEIITNATEAIVLEKGIISVTTGSTSLRKELEGSHSIRNDLTEGEYVYIQIADNGCGMDEETQAQIFQPLFTTKTSAKGLGLSAALGIARTHRGTIAVHTTPNHGTTIEIFLPAVERHLPAHSEDLIMAAETIVSRMGGRILIAEDEAYMRDLLQEALENTGYKVTTSEDGRDCIEKFDAAEGQFDCVILDMMMPNLDGEETLAEIRKRGSKIPAIITSGFVRQSTIDELRESGVKFLMKPYKLVDLMSQVAATLNREPQKV